MPRPRILLAAALLGLTASLAFAQETAVTVDPAIAAMTDEQLVEARQGTMEQNGMLVRRASRATGDEAVAAAATLLQNFTNLPALFREGSIVGRSKALPLIWENWDEFRGLFDHDAETAARALAAAQAGDFDTYSAALREISQSCSSCHFKFRG